VNVGVYGDDLQVVAPSGAFLSRDAAALRRVCQDLFESGQRTIVVDFAEVEEVDGFALASLASLLSRLRSQGGRLALISVNPDLRQLFGRVHFDLVIPIYPSLTQVLEAWPPDE
jgi:anti-anti-sigma factor